MLVILFMAQSFLSSNNRFSYLKNIKLTQNNTIEVNLVGKLERDILDLQRNVLVYKETASTSVLYKFNQLMEQLQLSLDEFIILTKEKDNNAQYQSLISRMQVHLSNYQSNFSKVIIGRKKRKALFEQGILNDFELLHQLISTEYKINNKNNSFQSHYLFNQAQNSVLQYVLFGEYKHIDTFNKNIEAAITLLSNDPTIKKQKTKLLTISQKIKENFQQLNQTTRGYIYLVNVVMASSANEFLYLTKELNKMVADEIVTTDQKIKNNSEVSGFNNNIFAGIGVILASIVAIFLTFRIILPINKITYIFQLLAKGEKIANIPEQARNDEIGELAKAASVFHDRNEQTQQLLKEAHKLNVQQIELNQKLSESKEKAVQATKSKSTFLANMSHEIRTPMNGIIGLVEHVLNGTLTKEQRDDLTKVSHSTQILMKVINDILDFSKIEAGKLDIEKIAFNTNNLFETLISNIALIAKERGLDLSFYANPDIPKTLIGDAFRISQVMFNLCTNAIKFTTEGKVKIEFYHTVTDVYGEIFLHARVTDTGIGMTKEQQSVIFNSFSQADESTSRKYGGTGLGLSIVNQLVKLMDGDVKCSSQPQKGSIFTVKFKLNSKNAEDRILKKININNKKLKYYVANEQPIINENYLKAIQAQYKIIDLNLLADSDINTLNKEDCLLIDINSVDDFEAIKKQLIKLNDAQIKTTLISSSVIISDTLVYPDNLSISCYSSPLSPKRIDILFNDMFTTSESDHMIYINMDDTIEHTFNGHILLVEDNAINRVVAGKVLNSLGLTYDIALDGKQAIDIFTKNPQKYDLLLMDIQMPIMDGYKATKTLREKGYNDIIICGLSANAMQQDYDNAYQVGMNEYLTKPIQKSALIETFSKHIK